MIDGGSSGRRLVGDEVFLDGSECRRFDDGETP